MSDQQFILYETPADRVARLVLNRPDARNAQNTRLLYELNDAFDRAAQDDAIRVIILAAKGPHFSAGHDLRQTPQEVAEAFQAHPRVGTWGGLTGSGAEPTVAVEREVFLGFSERWRNIPKPTIAQVQGKCIAGGLMLVWPCDLVVASEDAEFQDNTLSMGIAGIEWFAHPWELHPRKAKELLFTGASFPAHEAERLGMVNRVVPKDRLEAETLALAVEIAARPAFALKLAKRSANLAQDAAGRRVAMEAAFAYHELGHSHHMQAYGMAVDPEGIPDAVKKADNDPQSES
jgi:enoyl-CoA hydratase